MPKRRIAIEYVPTGTLQPAPYNPRKITDDAASRLARGIAEFGIVDPIIVRRTDNLVIGGHQRLQVAKDAGDDEVPVVYLDDIDDASSAALNVLLNNPSAMGEWDFPKLADVLSELDGNGFDATLTGFDPPELANILTYAGGSDGLVDPDTTPEVEEQVVSQRGDLWLLGDHRLFCGDATNAEDVERVLGGVVPLLMVTDPPYGVDYDPNWRNEANRWAGSNVKLGAAALGKVRNDNTGDWGNAVRLFRGSVVYLWYAALQTNVSAQMIGQAGIRIRNQIIWAKSIPVISRGHYHWQHELCWYGVRKGATAHWSGDRSQSTVWTIDKNRVSETGHGTQKPVECMERPLRNHGGPEDAVYDPFVGSGTTIIAAERQKRSCIAMDIDPFYVDVAVRRWQAYTGKVATLDGRSFAEVEAERIEPRV